MIKLIVLMNAFAALVAAFFGMTGEVTGDVSRDVVVNSLPQYENRVFFTSGGFQDYTDYGKYTYDSVGIEELENTIYFNEVTAEDAEEILAHVENFEVWVKTVGGELEANYDFDKSVVSEDDYFYIKTKYDQPIGDSFYDKFDNYSVYLFDVEGQVLYYFHNNI